MKTLEEVVIEASKKGLSVAIGGCNNGKDIEIMINNAPVCDNMEEVLKLNEQLSMTMVEKADGNIIASKAERMLNEFISYQDCDL